MASNTLQLILASNSAMHHCLFVDEIVQMICEELAPMSLGSLASMAQTCQQFKEPALNCLWYQLTALKPLLSCMPDDLWKMVGVNPTTSGQVEFWDLNRPMILSDLDRLKSYACRVRTLDLTDNETDLIKADVFHALRLPSGNALLPNLSTLDWYTDKLRFVNDTFSFISLFLGPKLVNMSIYVDTSENLQLSCISLLAYRYPNLRELNVGQYLSTNNVDDVVSSAICQWNNLRRLELCHPSTQALEHLSRLPQLHVFRISALGRCTLLYEVNQRTTLRPRSHGFPALKTLRAWTEEISNVFGLLQHFSSTPVKVLDIMAERSEPPSSYQTLFTLLEHHCNHATLSRMSVEVEQNDATLHINAEDTGSLDIGPLFVFRKLDNLVISTTHAVQLNRASIMGLTNAWPDIERLELGIEFPSSHPALNFNDFIYLATRLRKLVLLGIRFDASSVPNTVSAVKVDNTMLTGLRVGESPILDAWSVHNALLAHFPNLDYLDFYNLTEPEDPERSESQRRWELISMHPDVAMDD